ncbi:MAG: DUF521 domain-containing protein [Nitrosopumilaceae archaeon]|nr:DUF521 domain-containing protein [Nitrosopumilaceae archaeon]
MELTKEEELALKGEYGETLETAYRILVATGEATNAQKLIPIKWAHLSGVNYNTIGDAGEEFLAKLAKDARVKVMTTLNPMGFDFDSVSKYNLSEEFISKQKSIADSYKKMGVIPSFSCIPYEIFDMPENGTQVSFAESNAAIYANSMGSPDELAFGMLGYFAGKVADNSVQISGVSDMDRRQCKALCGGMGTSGRCGKFIMGEQAPNSEKIDFDKKEMQKIHDELNTADKGDIITLGSPQLGLKEIADLSWLLKGREFTKRCMVFCPRTVQEQARNLGYTNEIERAGCEILSDCCTCLSPLVDKNEIDSVITNSIKGAYYLNHSNGVGVNLKSLSQIIAEETR